MYIMNIEDKKHKTHNYIYYFKTGNSSEKKIIKQNEFFSRLEKFLIDLNF